MSVCIVFGTQNIDDPFYIQITRAAHARPSMLCILLVANGCHGNRPCEGIGHVSFN